MAVVMIGTGPHKASHTAAAVSAVPLTEGRAHHRSRSPCTGLRHADGRVDLLS